MADAEVGRLGDDAKAALREETAQFAAVTGTSLSAAALAVSVPFVAKDLLSVLLASALTHTVKSRLSEGCGVRVRAELSARGLAKSLKK